MGIIACLHRRNICTITAFQEFVTGNHALYKGILRKNVQLLKTLFSHDVNSQ